MNKDEDMQLVAFGRTSSVTEGGAGRTPLFLRYGTAASPRVGQACTVAGVWLRGVATARGTGAAGCNASSGPSGTLRAPACKPHAIYTGLIPKVAC